VTGIFMVDGQTYPTPKSHLIQFAARVRAVTPAKVPAILARRARSALPKLLRWLKSALAQRLDQQPPSEPTRQQFATGVQALVDRGVRVALLFSGSVFERYTYAGQLRDGFRGHRFIEQVICHHAPDLDHLMTPLSAQRRLLELVDDWMAQNPHSHAA
jgi:hypothetical protein